MPAASKNVLIPGHNHLLTTGANDLTFWSSVPEKINIEILYANHFAVGNMQEPYVNMNKNKIRKMCPQNILTKRKGKILPVAF